MIRKATIADKEEIALVLKESYNIDSVEEGIGVFENELSKGYHYIVSIEDGKIAGLVTWYVHGLAKHGLCELDRIAVSPDFQGKGVAKQLFDGLVAEAKKWYESKKGKLRKLYLLTHDDNERAHAFYEKMGFKNETSLKDHYYKDKPEKVYSIFFS
ncbi:GNAT family N-acetyltransferase [Candidatus Woesearchaeota archaeon]|nr:GNAT family N-acetyltransferase [Candidatus Woesearchaeota archaeon]